MTGLYKIAMSLSTAGRAARAVTSKKPWPKWLKWGLGGGAALGAGVAATKALGSKGNAFGAAANKGGFGGGKNIFNLENE